MRKAKSDIGMVVRALSFESLAANDHNLSWLWPAALSLEPLTLQARSTQASNLSFCMCARSLEIYSPWACPSSSRLKYALHVLKARMHCPAGHQGQQHRDHRGFGAALSPGSSC